jgi:hypothetical protein
VVIRSNLLLSPNQTYRDSLRRYLPNHPISAKVILDVFTARPEVENFGLDASYRLTEVATGKTVVTGTTSAPA